MAVHEELAEDVRYILKKGLKKFDKGEGKDMREYLVDRGREKMLKYLEYPVRDARHGLDYLR